MNHRSCLAATAAAALAFAAMSAQAGCVDPRTSAAGLPVIAMPARTAVVAQSPFARKNIVGTWLVTYKHGNDPAGQAYIQWHDDGTEWENINFPISGGTICMGSWMTVDARHVARNHYGWLYSDGLLSGYFNQTETVDVALNGTYTGVTSTQVYDVAGNLVAQVDGTSSAALIAP